MFTEPQITNVPTKFVELFSSLLKLGNLKRVIGSSEDFHSDGINSEVDIIDIDRVLRNTNKSSFFQKSLNFFLKPSNKTVALLSRFGLRHFGILDPVRRPFILQNIMSILCQKFFSFGASLIKSNLLPLPLSSKLNLFLKHIFLKCCGFNSNTLSNSVQAFPRFVSFDTIVNVSSEFFVGHVYNLSTSSNYYTINNYFVHNCQPPKEIKEGKPQQEHPRPDEIVSCFGPRAMRILKAMPNLEVVITMGWVAAKALLGGEPGIKTHEGQWFESSLLPGKAIFCLVHPSYVLRQKDVNPDAAGPTERCLEFFKYEYLQGNKDILGFAKKVKEEREL